MTSPVRLEKARACDGKAVHANRRGAELAIAAMRARDRRAAVGLNAYRCPHCPGWHIGHLPYGAREDA